MFRTLNAILCWPDPDPLSLVEEADDETPQERARRLARIQAQQEASSSRVIRIELWKQKPVRVIARVTAVLALAFGVMPAMVVSRDVSPDMLSFGLTEFTKEQLERCLARTRCLRLWVNGS